MHTKSFLSSCILLVLLFALSSFNVVVARNGDKSGNPFTPKGYLIRYWNKHVSNELPKPWFLLNKASPLNAAQYGTYSKLVADQNALTTQLQSFCSSANLMCAPDLSPSLEKHTGDIHFASYGNKNFTNYGTKEAGIGVNSFKNYTEEGNQFDNYGPDVQSFNNYSTNTPGGSGKFIITPQIAMRPTWGSIPMLTMELDRSKNSQIMPQFGLISLIDTSLPIPTTERVGNKNSNPTQTITQMVLNNLSKTMAKEVMTHILISSLTEVTRASKVMSKTLPHFPITGGKKVNSRWFEPGKFFREKMLKSGTIMPMPDIKDKMPKRSFLPRVIASKLPFSTSKIGELKKIFHAANDSQVAKMIGNALSECERAPSAGETKRCANSAEDMIDFAISVLGRNVVVRTTDNTKGSNGNIMIGSVKGINGGKVTKSVSCHQTLYPYLMYYCHSVPKVRVYEADILDPNSKAKINHGVAICHVDTSSWGPTHRAFVALGLGPGKIEVCHWIFENDMTWTTAD